jgi:hypothetical protein
LRSGCGRTESRSGMTYYAGFGPFTIRDTNEEVLREVSKLRLEKRLRETRQLRSGRSYALTFRRMLALPRRGRNAMKIAIL